MSNIKILSPFLESSLSPISYGYILPPPPSFSGTERSISVDGAKRIPVTYESSVRMKELKKPQAASTTDGITFGVKSASGNDLDFSRSFRTLPIKKAPYPEDPQSAQRFQDTDLKQDIYSTLPNIKPLKSTDISDKYSRDYNRSFSAEDSGGNSFYKPVSVWSPPQTRRDFDQLSSTSSPSSKRKENFIPVKVLHEEDNVGSRMRMDSMKDRGILHGMSTLEYIVIDAQ